MLRLSCSYNQFAWFFYSLWNNFHRQIFKIKDITNLIYSRTLALANRITDQLFSIYRHILFWGNLRKNCKAVLNSYIVQRAPLILTAISQHLFVIKIDFFQANVPPISSSFCNLQQEIRLQESELLVDRCSCSRTIYPLKLV